MTLIAGASPLLDRLRAVLPADRIATGSTEVAALTRDQSWLSPALAEARKQREATEGAKLGVLAAVAPRSVEELAAVVAIAAGERTPITLRGAGTSNFGLIDPSAGGLLLDLRRLTGEITVGDGFIRAPGGTILLDLERAARQHGAEVPILTTTYASATVAGWVAGGHVGLGSSNHGAVWDGIVRQVRLLTVEENPRILTLTGAEAEPVFHTFGVTGIVIEVELATAPLRRWLEVVGNFPDFGRASAFTTAISRDPRFAHRVVAAQEEEARNGLRALAPAIGTGASVLAILDGDQFDAADALAGQHGGALTPWQPWLLDGGEKPSIATLVYGHRMYWVKRLYPDASFLHIYPDPHVPDRDLTALKRQFGHALLIENKYIRSPWMARALGFTGVETLPAAVVAVRAQPGLAALIEHCDRAGIPYQNPHTHRIEDNGLFGDVAAIVELKAQGDPHDLIHRGRLAGARREP
jgi:FAD/FMN-containing dehydrogenase